jgi:hypothetical protein
VLLTAALLAALQLKEGLQELQRRPLTAERLKQNLLDSPDPERILEASLSPVLPKKDYFFCFVA